MKIVYRKAIPAGRRPLAAAALFLCLPWAAAQQAPPEAEILPLTREVARSERPSRELVSRRAKLLRQLLKSDPRRAASVALAKADSARLRARAPELASELEEQGVWEGDAEVLVEDDFTTGRSRTFLNLNTGAETLTVHLGGEAAGLRCGDVVRASGLRLGDDVGALEISVTGRKELNYCNSTGVQSVVVLLVNFGTNTLPAVVTPSFVQSMFFGSGRSLDGYWREVSYGATSASGDVFGPFTLSGTLDCSQSNAVRTAAIAAADGVVDFRNYNRLFIIMPNVGSCSIGLGTLGCGTLSSPGDGSFTASTSWLRADYVDDNDAGVQGAAHEGGHNMGLQHAASAAYSPSPLGSIGSAGTHDEYGDRYSAMGIGFSFNGRSFLGHYAAPHKNTLGWFAGGNVQQVQAPGTYLVESYTTATTGVKTLRIKRGLGPDDAWLWLEYRRPDGYDATWQTYTSQLYSGALIHYERPPEYPGYTRLLAFNPNSPGSFVQPALPAGSTWTDPFSELRITVNSATAGALSVTVNYDTPCAVLSANPANVPAAAGSSSVGVTAPAGCNWSAVSNANWITVTGGAGPGNGTVTFSFTANTGATARSGTITVGRQSLVVVQASPNSMPAPVSVTPASGVGAPGAAQTFQFVFSDADGATTLSTVSALFQTSPGTANACYIQYDRPSDRFRLWNNAATSWNSQVPGGSGGLSNSQCTLNTASSTRTVSGNTIQLNLSITFAAAFAGAKNVYGRALDVPGADSGWVQLGAWTIGTPPACTSLTLTPGVRSFSAAGGAATAAVTANACSWSAATDAPSWISFTTGAGAGSGTIGFTVAANTGAARMGRISVGGQSFQVMQGGVAAAQRFNDVAPGSPFYDYVSLMADYNITAGCSASPPLYCPNAEVTREQMAVFIVTALNRALGTPLTYNPAPYFEDMPPTSSFFPFVQRIRELNITAGCSVNPPLYCSGANITQGQMAVFMIAAWMQANNLTTFSYPATPYFTDVPATHPFFRFIQKMQELGFWTGCSATQYCESAPVTRGQMAPMILRAILGAP
jgi:M6 family metalloprotease-like protein